MMTMTQRVNEYDQPIGEPITEWQKRAFPAAIQSVGKYTIVTKLAASHMEALYTEYQRSNPSNWTYLFDEFPHTFEAFQQACLKKMEAEDRAFYVVLNKESAQPVGMFGLMRIDQANGVIEVGNVNFSDALKRTRISTEAHYLLATYVFEELQYRRYEWKCDSFNAPSIKTAKRLGFTYEGTFRNAVIYKGRSRDTCWFSMLEEEWPSRKKAFEQWLAEDNFDEQGLQIQKLESFR